MSGTQDAEAVIATLQQAKVKLRVAQRQTFEGLSRLNKVRDSIQAALGRLGQGNPAIAVLHDAEQTIKARAVEINDFSTRIDKAIEEVRQAASGGGSGGQSDGPAPGPTRSGDAPLQSIPEVPKFIRDAGAQLPKRLNDGDKTDGFVFIGERKLVDPVFASGDGQIRSGQALEGKRPAAGRGLVRKLALANVMDHVEPKVAAIMRRPGAPDDVTLVINNRPCDDPDRPLMCERILRHILPAGSRLRVFVSDGQATRPYKTYIGTGKGIDE